MKPCIAEAYVGMLENLIAKKATHELIGAIIGTFNICPEGGGDGGISASQAEKAAGARHRATGWGNVLYYDEKGTVRSHDSPSGLFKSLFGVEVTEDEVCRIASGSEKKECRALSVVENFRNRGFIVKGDGEEAPTPKGDLTSGAQERAYSEWKERLLASGKHLRIYNPKYPAVQAATKEK